MKELEKKTNIFPMTHTENRIKITSAQSLTFQMKNILTYLGTDGQRDE